MYDYSMNPLHILQCGTGNISDVSTKGDLNESGLYERICNILEIQCSRI